MVKRARYKPRGKIGPIVIGPDKKLSGFRPIDLPNTKEEIEQYIVDGALAALPSLGHRLYEIEDEPKRARENDFDFTLSTKGGTQYLELMEIAPLELTGGRYEGAPVSYHQGSMADLISTLIQKKVEKYGRGPGSWLHLLTYCTDWRFQLSGGVLSLVAFWAQKRRHCFSSITYFAPSSDDSGEVKVLFPLKPSAFSNFNENQFRDRLILRPDMDRIKTVGDDAVEAPLSWPPWRAT